jgi:hypothetical protein
MNCREAQHLLCTGSDRPLEAAAPALLEAHLATCARCRQVQADFAAGLAAWRVEAAAVVVPDARHEWQAVRRRIHGGASAGVSPIRPARKLVWFWRALPVAAATAIAAAIFLPRSAPDNTTAGAEGPAFARANSVEVPGTPASTMVFVDEKSGWLIVWASDTDGRSG